VVGIGLHIISDAMAEVSGVGRQKNCHGVTVNPFFQDRYSPNLRRVVLTHGLLGDWELGNESDNDWHCKYMYKRWD